MFRIGKVIVIWFIVLYSSSATCHAQEDTGVRLLMTLSIAIEDTIKLNINSVRIFDEEVLAMDDVLGYSAIVSIYDSDDEFYWLEIVRYNSQGELKSSESSVVYQLDSLRVRKFDINIMTINFGCNDLTFQVDRDSGIYFLLSKNDENGQIVINQRDTPFIFR